MRQLAVDDVEIGAADGTGGDLHRDLVIAGLSRRKVARLERPSWPMQHHCPHRDMMTGRERVASAAKGALRTVGRAPIR